MKSKYIEYTAEQLLRDDYFLESELHPTPDSVVFWLEESVKSPSLKKEIQWARLFLHGFKENMKSFPNLSHDEEFELWRRIQEQIKIKRKKKLISISLAFTVAAAMLLFIFSPFLFEKNAKVDYQDIITSSSDFSNNSETVLIISNKEIINISDKESNISYENDGEIHVNSAKIDRETKEEVELNQLIVPIGKRSFLTLADGTKIWINSGTTVIYPNSFMGNKREIYVDGEVFLDVNHNPSKPFYVKTRDLDIRVLGTSFNICAYTGDLNQHVTLVNGEVGISLKNKSRIILAPNELFEFNEETQQSNITVVDVNNYTSWKKGFFQFSQQPLAQIFERLSRYYGVQIKWDDNLSSLTCSGKLKLTENYYDVFEYLKKAAPIEVRFENEIIRIKHR